jgi:acetyl esterase/lipase
MRFLAATLLCVLRLPGAEFPPAELPLWPEGVPGLRADLPPERVVDGRLMSIKEPSLRIYRASPAKAGNPAAVICPGGGYGSLSMESEGYRYAEWLSSLGVTSFVLKYRVRDYGHPAPLQDVLRAVRLIRARASEFGVDPRRIGVVGSSAGGHLAATAGTLFDSPVGRTGAELDRVSARPDFLLLIYPVILMSGAASHAGSREALLGSKPAPELVRMMSPDLQVSPSTPPTFLVHTQADSIVPVDNSMAFFQALTRAGVPAELHVFDQGEHGQGMNYAPGPAAGWPKRAQEWLLSRGLLDSPRR